MKDRFTMGKRCYKCGGPVPNRTQVHICQACRAEKAGRNQEEVDRIRQAIAVAAALGHYPEGTL